MHNGLPQRVDRHLEELVDGLRHRLAEVPFLSPAEVERTFAVAAVIKGFYAVGLLSDAERSAWMKRLAAIVNTARRDVPGEGKAAPFGADATTDTREPGLDQRDASGLDLVRVIAGPFEPAGVLSLASVELYGDGVALRWNLRALPNLPLEDQLPRFELQDDVGTRYISRRRRAGGEATALRGETYFSPCVPERATQLHAAADKHEFRIALTS